MFAFLGVIDVALKDLVMGVHYALVFLFNSREIPIAKLGVSLVGLKLKSSIRRALRRSYVKNCSRILLLSHSRGRPHVLPSFLRHLLEVNLLDVLNLVRRLDNLACSDG